MPPTCSHRGGLWSVLWHRLALRGLRRHLLLLGRLWRHLRCLRLLNSRGLGKAGHLHQRRVVVVTNSLSRPKNGLRPVRVQQ
jgi:hypothetical protein